MAVRKILWYGAEVVKKVNAENKKIIERACILVETDIKKSMKPGSGNEYPRPGGKIHKASAPGEPPAVDTGRLRSSYTHEVEGTTGYVGTNVKYALPLEIGIGMQPRPHIRPALHRNEKKILALFKKII